MRYFKLGQDTRMPNGVLLTDINSIHGYFEYRKCNAFALESFFVSIVHSSPVNYYPDILDRQIFMVKGAVKDVMNVLVPDMEYKHCCLVDDANDVFERYHVPMLPTMDVQEGVADALPIFRVADESKLDVLASLEFVEALLRRKPKGCRMVQWPTYPM